MLVIHVDVIEAFDRAGLRILDHRAVGSAQIAEAALPRRLRPLRAHFEDLFLRGQPGQRVAATCPLRATERPASDEACERFWRRNLLVEFHLDGDAF